MPATNYTEEINRLETVLCANAEILHPTVIDSCMENAWGMGLSEDNDPDAFWAEVLSELKGEMDAEGLL